MRKVRLSARVTTTTTTTTSDTEGSRDAPELARGPAVVDGEEREVVALGLVELGLLGVGLRLLLLGAVEDAAADAQHGDDGEDLLGALEVDTGDEHLGERRLDGQVGHLAAEAGEEALVVERRQRVQVLERRDHRLLRRRVHKVEVEQVVDACGRARVEGGGVSRGACAWRETVSRKRTSYREREKNVPMALSMRIVWARFWRWMSGIELGIISLRYAASVYRR